MREMPDVVRQGRGLLNHGERIVDVALRPLTVHPAPEAAEHAIESPASRWQYVVVELARDARAFHFLRSDISRPARS